MGTWAAASFQNFTDRLAARLKQNIGGLDSELSGATNISLWDTVDGIGDPSVESALGSYALAVDRHSLPENYYSALTAVLNRTKYRDLVGAVNALVTSAGGGSYSGLNAYLTAAGATLHPLAAELFRSALGEAAFTASSDVPNVFAPNYQTRAADRIYTGADGSLAEDTTDAASAGTADVALFASNADALYIGCTRKFAQVIAGLSTLASVTVAPTFQYWNGAAWTTLTVTDNSVGFTKNDTIKWTVPADWERCYKDAGGTAFAEKTPLYYVRIARAAVTVVTPPVGTCLRVVPSAILNGASGSNHLGVDQPPLAICRVTATNVLVVESIAGIDYARFAEGAVRLRALTPFSANVTPTISYVNQAGANQTQAQSAWTSPAALGTAAVTLNGADTGVRSVLTTGWAVSTTALGVFEVYHAEDRTPTL